MAVLCFASCGGEKQPEETKGQQDNQGDSQGDQAEDKWANVNFNGDEIIISLSTYEVGVVTSSGATNSIKYIKGPDAYTTDSVQNAVFDRNKKVSEKLGLNVRFLETDYPGVADKVFEVIENFVLADLEDSPDIINAMSYGIVRGGIKGILYNALTKDYTNYFDFTHENWYSDFMYENTLDESKLFLLAGDYFIDILRFSYGVLVNLDMYDEVFASEGGSAALFDLINAGDWNYDEMARCIQKAYVDAGTIGQYDSEDTFGAVNDQWWLVRSTMSTAGIDVFETKNGKLQYVEDITELHNYTDKMLKLTGTDGFYLEIGSGPNPTYDHTDLFIKGKSLFAFDSPVLVMEGTLLQNMDDKAGMIPYPKYADEDYGALCTDNGNVGGILYNSDKFTESSAYLQMSTEESNGGKGTLLFEYYDVALKYKLSNTPEQVAMLEFIRDGLCCPKTILYDNFFARNVSMKSVGNHTGASLASGTNTFASGWESQYDALQDNLEQTLATYGQQN
jgi:hypothetical protein